MLIKDSFSYGGPYEDVKPIASPNKELGADFFNRLGEDSCQMTRTSMKALVVWTAYTGGTTKTYIDSEITVRTQWGTGDAAKPTIEKTANGLYTVTFPASFADVLGDSDHDESVSFIDGTPEWRTGDATDLPENNNFKILTIVSNVITVAAFSGGALGDAGDVSATAFTLSLKLW